MISITATEELIRLVKHRKVEGFPIEVKFSCKKDVTPE